MEINDLEKTMTLLNSLERELIAMLPVNKKTEIDASTARKLKLFGELCGAVGCLEHYKNFLDWRKITENDLNKEK